MDKNDKNIKSKTNSSKIYISEIFKRNWKLKSKRLITKLKKKLIKQIRNSNNEDNERINSNIKNNSINHILKNINSEFDFYNYCINKNINNNIYNFINNFNRINNYISKDGLIYENNNNNQNKSRNVRIFNDPFINNIKDLKNNLIISDNYSCQSLVH